MAYAIKVNRIDRDGYEIERLTRYVDCAWNPTAMQYGTQHKADAKTWKTRKGAEQFRTNKLSKLSGKDYLRIEVVEA